MKTVMICIGLVAALGAMGYLAASAGAQRWLSLREWWRRTTCSHKHGHLLAIELDGTSVHECDGCGKYIRTPLQR